MNLAEITADDRKALRHQAVLSACRLCGLKHSDRFARKSCFSDEKDVSPSDLRAILELSYGESYAEKEKTAEKSRRKRFRNA